MGGPLFAQSEDLHSVWCTCTQRHLFRTLGDLHATLEGYTYWQGRYVTALCQFRGYIVLGTNAPPPMSVRTLSTLSVALRSMEPKSCL